jgi:hypothetical protein
MRNNGQKRIILSSLKEARRGMFSHYLRRAIRVLFPHIYVIGVRCHIGRAVVGDRCPRSQAPAGLRESLHGGLPDIHTFLALLFQRAHVACQSPRCPPRRAAHLAGADASSRAGSMPVSCAVFHPPPWLRLALTSSCSLRLSRVRGGRLECRRGATESSVRLRAYGSRPVDAAKRGRGLRCGSVRSARRVRACIDVLTPA